MSASLWVEHNRLLEVLDGLDSAVVQAWVGIARWSWANDYDGWVPIEPGTPPPRVAEALGDMVERGVLQQVPGGYFLGLRGEVWEISEDAPGGMA